jgi:hypothetical protein
MQVEHARGTFANWHIHVLLVYREQAGQAVRVLTGVISGPFCPKFLHFFFADKI